jgi:hypothetical protein
VALPSSRHGTEGTNLPAAVFICTILLAAVFICTILLAAVFISIKTLTQILAFFLSEVPCILLISLANVGLIFQHPSSLLLQANDCLQVCLMMEMVGIVLFEDIALLMVVGHQNTLFHAALEDISVVLAAGLLMPALFGIVQPLLPQSPQSALLLSYKPYIDSRVSVLWFFGPLE